MSTAILSTSSLETGSLPFTSSSDAPPTLPKEAYTDWSGWVRLDLAHADCSKWLEKLLPDVPRPVRQSLVAEETRPRADTYGDGVLLILRAANLNPGKRAHDMASVRIWADSKRLVTVQRQRIRALGDVEGMMKDGTEGVQKSGGVLAAINQKIIDRLDPVLAELEEKVYGLEDDMLDSPRSELRPQITGCRKEVTFFRRYIAPQREVLVRLKSLPLPWLEVGDQIQLIGSNDHLTRFVENLDTIRERCLILHEELTTTLADQLNNRMYILSIVSIIFLPLGFLTGLLGVNLGGIPGADNPIAFIIFLGILVAMLVACALFLRVRRWF